MKRRKSANKAKRKNRQNKRLPTQIELVVGAPSALVVSAHYRSGAGIHQDRRRKKSRKHDWKRDL